MIDGWGFSCETVPRGMLLVLADDESTLVQVMVGAIRQQAITWANVDTDVWGLMASLGLKEFKNSAEQITWMP